jgi:hypothetical protein
MELEPEVAIKISILNESTNPQDVISHGYEQIVAFRNLVVRIINCDHHCIDLSNFPNIKQIIEELDK